MCQQDQQDSEGLTGQTYANAASAKFARFGIHLERSEGDASRELGLS
jgi:hypothetical protein